jgi:hypothetical protein
MFFGIGWVLKGVELNHEDQITPVQDMKEGGEEFRLGTQPSFVSSLFMVRFWGLCLGLDMSPA